MPVIHNGEIRLASEQQGKHVVLAKLAAKMTSRPASLVNLVHSRIGS
jgi:hypothetical protein